MKSERIHPSQVPLFDRLYLDYIGAADSLRSLYAIDANVSALKAAASARPFSSPQRAQLVAILRQQYEKLKVDGGVDRSLNLLAQEGTVTVTTGHQLNLCGGPLYFIYKILSTIKLAEELNAKADQPFVVPVFWMATEDHDWEEVNHFHLFGNTYTCEYTQGGAVGHQDTYQVSQLLSGIEDLPAFIKEAYANSTSLAEATRAWVHHLFQSYGLLIIDGDHPELKRQFVPLLKKEVEEKFVHAAISQSESVLSAMGYKSQAHARELNLFYLNKFSRERIVEEGSTFEVMGEDISFSKESLLKEMEMHPAKFSPNVLLRPLYQETVLPNIAYIGGPAEVAYWLQLKEAFTSASLPFPAIIPRQNILYLSKSLGVKIDKLKLNTGELFLTLHEQKKKLIGADEDPRINLEHEERLLAAYYARLKEVAVGVDTTLVASMAAEEQKAMKQLEEVRKRFRKAIERKSEQEMKQLEQVREKLFPSGKLQERYDNFLQYYIGDPEWLVKIHAAIDPLDFNFLVLRDE